MVGMPVLLVLEHAVRYMYTTAYMHVACSIVHAGLASSIHLLVIFRGIKQTGRSIICSVMFSSLCSYPNSH